MTDTLRTRIVYKMDGDECVAFMPELESSPGFITCYAHIGQHGGASVDYMLSLRDATAEESEDLRRELFFQGYREKTRFRPFPPVSCRYGAPMGRPNTRTGFEPDDSLCVAGPVGEYDSGGAYWGSSLGNGPIWAVWERANGHEGVVYVRAHSREQAKRIALES